MSRFTDAVRAGVRAMRQDLGPKPYAVAGRPVRCPHCGHTRFVARDVLLNTRGAAFVRRDWLNHGAATLTCVECACIQWFGAAPQAVSE